jgi:hypothetical protein
VEWGESKIKKIKISSELNTGGCSGLGSPLFNPSQVQAEALHRCGEPLLHA